jgi:hypothetical protein
MGSVFFVVKKIIKPRIVDNYEWGHLDYRDAILLECFQPHFVHNELY